MKILKFINIYLNRYLLLLLPALIFVCTVFTHHFLFKPPDKLYDSKYTYQMIAFPLPSTEALFSDQYITSEKRAIDPVILSSQIREDKTLFDRGVLAGCPLTADSWYRGHFELRPDRIAGTLSIMLNSLSKEDTKNCRKFFYDIFFKANLDVYNLVKRTVSETLSRLEFVLKNLKEEKKNIYENYKKYPPNSFEIELQMINSSILGIQKEIYDNKNLMNTINKVEKKDLKATEASSILMLTSHKLNLLISIIFGLFVSIIIITIVEFKKISEIIKN